MRVFASQVPARAVAFRRGGAGARLGGALWRGDFHGSGAFWLGLRLQIPVRIPQGQPG